MKRIFAGLLLAIMLVLSLSPMAMAQSVAGQALYTGTISMETTALAAPIEGSSGEKMPAGTRVIILQQMGTWYQVKARSSDAVGWVPTNVVSRNASSRIIPGVVISQNVSLREEPRTNATRLARPSNGAVLDILSESNGWYYATYYDKDGQVFTGYVLVDYIVINPVYLTTTKSTYVYSTPSRSSKKVGQITTGTPLLIIGEYNNFWVVNLRSASGFIYMNDIEGF
jgi:uncharacterized protein YgiM (DUF1202 family)